MGKAVAPPLVSPQSLSPRYYLLLSALRGAFFVLSFILGIIKSMNTNNEHTCGACGRPWKVGKPTCKCYEGCLTEYPCAAPACIRKNADPCKAKAVIPAVTTETVDGITNLANCFVHVANINTTFYIDDKHRPMITWAGPVEVGSYDIEENELKLRSQTLFTTINGVFSEVYFDKTGVGHIIGQEV